MADPEGLAVRIRPQGFIFIWVLGVKAREQKMIRESLLALFLTSQTVPPYWPYNQKSDLQQILTQRGDSATVNEANEAKGTREAREVKNAKKFERPAVPILNYHWIVPETHKCAFSRYFQTKGQLRNTIRNMKKKGYNFITVSELEKLIAGYDSTEFDTTKYALLTFDDGLECVYNNAYPILLKENVKATLFITTAVIRDSISGPYLSWKKLKEMYKSGLIDVQSHTHNSHVAKGRGSVITVKGADEDSTEYMLRIFADFLKSKWIIEEKIGNKVIAIAWPFGLSNDVARRMASLAGYKLCFTVNGENFKFGKDYRDLPRIEVGEIQ